jgi:membrane protein DedA with SNARE-associated domain
MTDQLVQWFDAWCVQHGQAAVFVIMAVGLIGVPMTEETALTVFGLLVHRGTLDFVPSVAAAFLGTACGITVMYVLGRTLGVAAVHRYGRRVGVTEQRMAVAHDWFERIGKWVLAVGYFIPVVRQLTGIAAGVTRVGYMEFAAFAYAGALVWVTAFISLGTFLGMQWALVCRHALWAGALLAGAIVLALVIRFRHRRRS